MINDKLNCNQVTILGTYEDDYACEEVEPMTQCCATVQCTGEGEIN